MQEVIRKDFIIKDGSTITFNGAPLDANMDIQASYTVNSASLNDLIPDASAIIQQPNVRVNCIMNLSGMLVRPTIKLGIELPNEEMKYKHWYVIISVGRANEYADSLFAGYWQVLYGRCP